MCDHVLVNSGSPCPGGLRLNQDQCTNYAVSIGWSFHYKYTKCGDDLYPQGCSRDDSYGANRVIYYGCSASYNVQECSVTTPCVCPCYVGPPLAPSAQATATPPPLPPIIPAPPTPPPTPTVCTVDCETEFETCCTEGPGYVTCRAELLGGSGRLNAVCTKDCTLTAGMLALDRDHNCTKICEAEYTSCVRDGPGKQACSQQLQQV